MNESDPRSNEHYLSSSENESSENRFKSRTGLKFSGLIFSTAQVVFITARITFIHIDNIDTKSPQKSKAAW